MRRAQAPKKKPPEGGIFQPEEPVTSSRWQPWKRRPQTTKRRSRRCWQRRRQTKQHQRRHRRQPERAPEREPGQRRARGPEREPAPALPSCRRRRARRQQRGPPRRAISSFQGSFSGTNNFRKLSVRRNGRKDQNAVTRAPAVQLWIISPKKITPNKPLRECPRGKACHKPRVLAENDGELLRSHSARFSCSSSRRSGSAPV
jgi:hypothetical protein